MAVNYNPIAPATVNITVLLTGAIPTPPALLNGNLIATVAVANPGYTILPGGLIEDIASTSTFGIALMESAAVDLINSLTPLNANTWLLLQLGQIYGVPQGQDTNTSVYVVFTGTPGFTVGPGFQVGDGTYVYLVQDTTIINTNGVSNPTLTIATVAGSWAVPENTVTQIISSVPSSITLAVSNPNTGIPSPGPQTEEDYRAQVLQAGLSPAGGCASYCKTLLNAVPGVQPRLVSIVQVNGGGWEIIVGGGDQFAVGNAIYNSGLDISDLVGSTLGVTGITQANPGVVTTNLNHGFITGQTGVSIEGVSSMLGANGGPYTVTVISENTFSFGVNTTGFAPYTPGSGGVVTPNNRNLSVSIISTPNVYTVPFVVPPQQSVNVQLIWNTIAPFLVSEAAVAQVGAGPLVDYINSVPVGQPINLFELDLVFQDAIVNLIPTPYLSRLIWTISVNGVEIAPVTGTGLVYGDPESYFFTTAASVTVTQG